uniref:Uncharacterized protein n=1 Tax=Lactuca sativa TaxID=4236 RepID=A0A9R1VH43_LACSA|nr:hypothetical protein LSAT_V11C500242610 [Lactuca sativa]
MYLESTGISNAIYYFNNFLAQEKAKAQIFLHKHTYEMLRFEYLDIIHPIIILNSRDEWRTLRCQDFKKVNKYISVLFIVCSQLKYCGQELQKFTRYSDLKPCLLVAEQNNVNLVKNHESHPTRSIALPKENATK